MIAGGVSTRVVYDLKLIEVQIEQYMFVGVGHARQKKLIEVLFKRRAIEQARQCVVRTLVIEFGFESRCFAAILEDQNLT